MTAAGTRISRPRSPARITTSAVMTFVMLPIGRSLSGSRLHSSVPVAASASTAPLAFTLRSALTTGLGVAAGPVAALGDGLAGAADRDGGGECSAADADGGPVAEQAV